MLQGHHRLLQHTTITMCRMMRYVTTYVGSLHSTASSGPRLTLWQILWSADWHPVVAYWGCSLPPKLHFLNCKP